MCERMLLDMYKFAECRPNSNGQILPLWDAEFGYILYQHVPKVYALCVANQIKRVEICRGMHPFYYFLPKSLVEEKSCSFQSSLNMQAQHEIPKHHKAMPNYAPFVYKMPPYFYVYNKHNREWNGDPINTFLPRDLDMIFGELCFPAIYHRARNEKSLGTDDKTQLTHDFEVALRHNISTTRDILENNDRDMMNALQIVLAKNARLVVGVQGGMGVMSSLIGARLLVLCKKGSECNKDYHFYPRIHNSTIIITQSYGTIKRFIRHTCGISSYFHAF